MQLLQKNQNLLERENLITTSAKDDTWSKILEESEDMESPDCYTALTTSMEHISARGVRKKFKVSTVDGVQVGTYNLGSPNENNVFHLQATTMSGDNRDTKRTNPEGMSDRLLVRFVQPNLGLMIRTQTELMLTMPELKNNPAELKKLMMERINPDLLYTTLLEETVETDADGNFEKDYIIPDDWPAAPISIEIIYATDWASEKAATRGSDDFATYFGIVLEIWIEIIAVVLSGGTLAIPILVKDVAEISYVVYQMVIAKYRGVENKYGCAFPVNYTLAHIYTINYKSDIDLAQYLSATQMSGLDALMEEERQQSAAALKIFGAVVSAILIGGLWASMRRN
jgi:hypothetical protein